MSEIEDHEEEFTEPPKKRNYVDKFLFIILLILIALLVRKFFFADQAAPVIPNNQTIDQSIILANETEINFSGREVYVEIIHFKGCEKCYNTGYVLDYLNEFDLDLLISERYVQDSEEDQKLIEDLSVSKLPVVILRKDIAGLDKILTKFEKRVNALLFEAPMPPFYYIHSEKIIGYVESIHLKNKDCKVCSKIGQLLHDMDVKMGVTFTKKAGIYMDSVEGKELVEKYNLTKIPTLIFKGDLLEYPLIAKTWDKIGSIESDGALVLRVINPPYTNPRTGEIEGIVDVTFLTDPSCKDCFDAVKAAEVVKEKYKLVFGTSRIVDVNSAEGKELIKKFNIKKAPTFILSENAQLYPGLMMDWEKKLGFITDDNSLIFTGY